MRSEKLNLGHRDILQAKLRGVGTPIAECSFPNLYLFRHNHDYEMISDKEIFIKGRTYDGFTYIMPTRDIRGMDAGYVKGVMGGVDFIFPVAEEWLGVFPESDFTRSYSDGDTDYMYTVEKMSTYRGGKLHKKRNLLKQFLASYKPEAFPLRADRMDDARDILRVWLNDAGQAAGETDYGPAMEAFDMYEELALCGGIYYVEGEPAGFIIGEELNGETFALHFAKGKRKFKGLYQYMYNSFAKILPEKYRYFNFEQDLGKLALKIAKSSYLPDKMIKKFRVGLK
jgi:hypothetical protein